MSAQDTTAGCSFKANVVNLNSTRELKSKQVLFSTAAHATHGGGKVFQGLEEIPDENSVIVKHEQNTS